MATVTVDYFGMSGTGRTVTEAKRDAGEKIKRALGGYYTPKVIEFRGVAMLVWRTPEGYLYKNIHDETGWRDGGTCSGYETEAEAVRAAYSHLAQWTWTHADGTEAPEFLTDKTDRYEFRQWAEFQMRYQRGKAAGLNDNDAHSYAGRNPARPELQAMVPA